MTLAIDCAEESGQERITEQTIDRFYANTPQLADKLRMVSGKPPVPLWKGLKAFVMDQPGEQDFFTVQRNIKNVDATFASIRYFSVMHLDAHIGEYF